MISGLENSLQKCVTSMFQETAASPAKSDQQTVIDKQTDNKEVIPVSACLFQGHKKRSILGLTDFMVAKRAMHLALDPLITPSAYCSPRRIMAG